MNKNNSLFSENSLTYENSLDEEWLYRLELLIEYAFFCNTINLETYKQFQLWLKNEHKYMGENFVQKQRFQKIIYGFGYEKHGELKYIVDTQKSSIYRNFYALEAKGYTLSPIFSKQYWYRLCDELPNVIGAFKTELKNNCNWEYMDNVKALRKRMHDKEAFDMEHLIGAVRNRYGEDAANTLLSYGYRWGIL